jgi:arabinofuranosyltransferase
VHADDATTAPAPGPIAGAPLASGAIPVRPWLALAALGSLVALLAHAWSYRFLTDDAFIAFRYARNLARGAGLVFNPGHERVEGYTSFLWVLVLAGTDRLGIAPEIVAPWLSGAATVALWALLAWAAWRWSAPEGRAWALLVPLLGLAATRSIAVWSTSGFETRWFEALVFAGTLRLTVELEAGRRALPWSGLLLGLGAWTRPEGVLLGLCAYGSAVALTLARGGWRELPLRNAGPFVLLVAGHLLFRLAYYGEWLPNTYFAKVGGRWWWDSGARYLLAFVLEYGLYLWVPLLLVGMRTLIAERHASLVALTGAVLVPLLLSVAAVGGDHFEYRPLDLCFPFLLLLLGQGARRWWRSPLGRVGLALVLTLIAVGLWQLPRRSHQEFPAEYMSGFPGMLLERSDQARDFLAPERDPIYRWPLLRAIAARHRDLTRTLTGQFVALRQEEHRGFLATVVPEGRRLRRLVADGVLPADLYLATDCVGAIPYYSGLRTLDRLGLTDARVAHSAGQARRVMAHDKHASLEYARERGVDLWASDAVHVLWQVTDDKLMHMVRAAARSGGDTYGAALADGTFLVADLPLGVERARRRMPSIELLPLAGDRFVGHYLEMAIAAYRDSLARDAVNPVALQRLAYLMTVIGDLDQAAELFQRLTRAIPDSREAWESLAQAEKHRGRDSEAEAALRHALALAERTEDLSTANRLRAQLLPAAPAAPTSR